MRVNSRMTRPFVSLVRRRGARRCFGILLQCSALVASSAALVAAQQRFDETVVVTGTAEPLRLFEVGRSLEIVTREQITELPVRTLADALRLAHGVEVRARGDAGTQVDLSLRGASFGQTLVLVDGVRLNDAQTGHHNGDIPVPLDEVERIEVLEGPGSSLYGADAFGGVVNVITRQDSQPRLEGGVAGGSSGYGEAALVARAKGEHLAGALSLSAQRSDGFLPGNASAYCRDCRAADRDFRVLSARGRISAGRNTRLNLSYLDKEFGALGFYGNAPSREWTSQSLASLERSFSLGERAGGSFLAYGRAHDDHFLFDRRNPALSDNRHESRAVGVSVRLHRSIGPHTLSAGTETGADWVDSTTLGDRGFGRASLFAEAAARVASLVVRPGLRFDAYGRFGSAVSPALALGGRLSPRLRWRASAGRAFRVPTFTELYYHDPANLGSPNLRPESAWGSDTGVDLELGRTAGASATAFGRWESNVIDWVRPSPAERWTTENVRDVTTYGVETSAWQRLLGVELRERYTWLDTSAPALSRQSKYVLDFARHALGADARVALPGAFRLAPSLEYRRKRNGRDWWLLDLRLTRPFGRLALSLEGRNLLDARYQEIVGVERPGRSLVVGVRASAR